MTDKSGLQNIAAILPVRICLNMIVKNESKIIERCLAAALPFIDTWCIADTGSTDDTPVKIEKFFAEHKIPGQLVRTEFKNFAQGRNAALDAARLWPGWDYLLLIDADMVIRGTIDKFALSAPAYELMQRDGIREYTNTRLLRRDAPAKYMSVTHEYLSVEGVQSLPPGCHIDDIGDGGSKSDKGDRDIRLLTEGLQEEPKNERYMFYLANTYREMDRPHRAVPWYKKRIEQGGWDEETWWSIYSLALCYKDLDDEANFFKSCIDAYNFRPERGESLKLLAQYYRERGKSEIALLISETLSATEKPNDRLFLERAVYDYGADQEIAISGYYSKLPRRREAGYQACARLTTHPYDFVRSEAHKNFTFYAKSASELFGAEIREIDFRPGVGWAPMNPSVCIGPDNRRLVLVRTVNYVVTDGQYPTNDGSGIIRTNNYIVEMNDAWKPIKSTLIEDVTSTPKGQFPVEGYEDCRLWWAESATGYFVSATERDFTDNSNGNCEMVLATLDSKWRIEEVNPIRDYESGKTQKNWMPIVGEPGKFIYLCDPTIVIDTSREERTVELARHEAPVCLVDLRGGSQLIPHGDSWLCLTHEVAWRPERVYLHRFVRFDNEFRITAISDPFYFSKVGIEFCAGLARDGEKLVVSFGVNDASAHLAFFDPKAVDRALHAF